MVRRRRVRARLGMRGLRADGARWIWPSALGRQPSAADLGTHRCAGPRAEGREPRTQYHSYMPTPTVRHTALAPLLTLAVTLAACSGGGGGGITTPPTTNPPVTPVD